REGVARRAEPGDVVLTPWRPLRLPPQPPIAADAELGMDRRPHPGGAVLAYRALPHRGRVGRGDRARRRAAVLPSSLVDVPQPLPRPRAAPDQDGRAATSARLPLARPRVPR